MPATHHLKTWPEYFTRVWDGEKPFEIRFDDRGYQPGDTVYLHEFDRSVQHCGCGPAYHTDRVTCRKYTGRWIEATIGFLAASTPPRGSQPGFQGRGYVVFALLNLVTSDDELADLSDPDPERRERDCRCRSLARETGGYTTGCPVHDPQLTDEQRAARVAAPTPLRLSVWADGLVAAERDGRVRVGFDPATPARAPAADVWEGVSGVRTPSGPPGSRPASGPRPGREVPDT